jgi:hypothetical protein
MRSLARDPESTRLVARCADGVAGDVLELIACLHLIDRDGPQHGPALDGAALKA